MLCEGCRPAEVPSEPHATPLPRSEWPPAPTFDGSALWHELHTRALAYEGDADAERQWLLALAMRLPCGTCRGHWTTYLRDNPPDLANYFAWSVEAHNAVNARIGKPEMTLEEAHATCATAS